MAVSQKNVVKQEKSKAELLAQLEKLDNRLGKGVGAVRERTKIAAKLEALKN